MTRSRPNTFQALLVYSLLQAPVSLIHINARYDFFVFLTSDGLVRLGECFLSRGTMNVFKKYWGISLASLAAGVFLVGILFVKDPGSAGQFASNYFAAGEFARGVFASGEFAAGIFAAGTFAVGVFSIGVFSIGIFSAGLFSIGLYGVGLFVLAKYRKPLQIATTAGESGSEGQTGVK